MEFQNSLTVFLCLTGATDSSPFVERDENPWKRAWISFRSGRDIVSILNKLSSSLATAPRQRDALAGKTAYNLAICISFCDSLYRFFSPQLGFGLSVSQQLEQFSSLPTYTGSVRCVAWHPYLSLLALALIDNIIHLQVSPKHFPSETHSVRDTSFYLNSAYYRPYVDCYTGHKWLVH